MKFKDEDLHQLEEWISYYGTFEDKSKRYYRKGHEEEAAFCLRLREDFLTEIERKVREIGVKNIPTQMLLRIWNKWTLRKDLRKEIRGSIRKELKYRLEEHFEEYEE